MSIEDLVDDKELVVVMTEAQYVKSVPAAQFKTQARGGRGVSGAKLKADDLIRHVIFTTSHAHLLFFSNRGKVYRLRALEIPERERTAKGMPIVNLLPLQAGETIQAIIDTRDFAGERFLFFATRKGTVKKTAFDAYDSSRRDGLIALNLRDDDELVRVIETGGGDDIFMVSRRGMTIRFSEDDVRPMGRSAAGVRGMKLRADDEVVSVDVARDDTAILMVTEAGYGKRTQLEHYNRAGPWRPRRDRHQAHRAQGRGGRRVHGRHRRRHRRRFVGRRDHPHAGPRDLLAGPRRHRGAGDEPRRRSDRGVGRADPGERHRRLNVARTGSGPDDRAGDRTDSARNEGGCRAGRRVGRRGGRVEGGWRDRRGQAVPLALVVVVLALVLMMAIGSVGGLAVDASRARTAADAAALAAVEGGRPAAVRLAAEHGATLVAYRASGPADDRLVTVRVRVGRATAAAAATNRGP